MERLTFTNVEERAENLGYRLEQNDQYHNGEYHLMEWMDGGASRTVGHFKTLTLVVDKLEYL